MSGRRELQPLLDAFESIALLVEAWLNQRMIAVDVGDALFRDARAFLEGLRAGFLPA